MKTHAEATFEIKSWDEKTWDGKPASEISGEKLTHARVTYAYSGDIKGNSQVQYLMTYRPDGTANFVGIEQIEGKIGDRSGSFVMQHSGIFDAAGVKGALFIVPGSGTGELKNLSGGGNFALVGEQPHYPITLDLEF